MPFLDSIPKSVGWNERLKRKTPSPNHIHEVNAMNELSQQHVQGPVTCSCSIRILHHVSSNRCGLNTEQWVHVKPTHTLREVWSRAACQMECQLAVYSFCVWINDLSIITLLPFTLYTLSNSIALQKKIASSRKYFRYHHKTNTGEFAIIAPSDKISPFSLALLLPTFAYWTISFILLLFCSAEQGKDK